MPTTRVPAGPSPSRGRGARRSRRTPSGGIWGPGAGGEPEGVSALDGFSPRTRAWFEGAFDAPTPAQELGWRAIASGKHTLIQAPTGSGKTLAAFLYGIDKLTDSPGEGLRLLYVSPLKALN